MARDSSEEVHVGLAAAPYGRVPHIRPPILARSTPHYWIYLQGTLVPASTKLAITTRV
jgi:hypothetical protein